ncbi:MAG: 2-isopropylmalate synthase [Clostridiales bacterium]|jgi:2-isopropylmalate synthase|nr:2-isopropylmalate synthase [Clostridiales bacterium]
MRTIKIFDTTLRDGEQSPGCSMRLSEKLEIAKQLEILGVDIIEAGFAISSPGDFESVASVAKTVKNCTVASLARAKKEDIDAAYHALQGAVDPRIHIFLATSPLHLQYKLKISQDEALHRIAASVAYARTLCANVEFSAEDAARTDLEFLAKAFTVAVKAGATVINVPDTVGYCLPGEMSQKVEYLLGHVDGIEKVEISAHNHDDLGMAVANSLSMVLAGASQIECTVNGIGERAGNTALEEVVMAIHTRAALFGCTTRINTKEIYKTSRLLSSVTGVSVPPAKAVVGANAYAHESGIHQHGVLANPETYEIINPADVGIPQNKIVLGKHSGRHAFAEHLKELGYTLTDEQINKAFDDFKALCDKKKYVSNKDVQALIAGNVMSDSKYSLLDFSVESHKDEDSVADLALQCGEKRMQRTATGGGPVNSAFKALNALFDKEIELLDYAVTSVGAGVDALGEASVRLGYNGMTVHGRGVSTDVLEASILAYLDGVNKF